MSIICACGSTFSRYGRHSGIISARTRADRCTASLDRTAAGCRCATQRAVIVDAASAKAKTLPGAKDWDAPATIDDLLRCGSSGGSMLDVALLRLREIDMRSGSVQAAPSVRCRRHRALTVPLPPGQPYCRFPLGGSGRRGRWVFLDSWAWSGFPWIMRFCPLNRRLTPTSGCIVTLHDRRSQGS